MIFNLDAVRIKAEVLWKMMIPVLLRCIGCGKAYEIDENVYTCKRCNDLLEIELDLEPLKQRLSKAERKKRPLSVWRYLELIPIRDTSKIVTLNEGGTGLYRCEKLGAFLGLDHLYVKNEGENPTGSFKDRGMTVGVTRAVEQGVKSVVCASTGNTSASLAAYGAKAGIKRIVIIPSGKVAYGKLAQAIAYGAQIVQVQGNFDEALKIVLMLSERHREIYLLNSVNPFRIEGQKTVALEICDQLGREPECVMMPVGNAGNISAAWKGFKEFYQLGEVKGLPRMIGVQAEGAAPIAEAVKERRQEVRPVSKPETIASAIRIGSPVSWKKALKAIYESKGTAETVSDQEILEAQSLLARLEGLFVEPASASPIAALRKLLRNGVVEKDELVVCITTGHGLKDPDVVTRMYEKPVEVEASLDSIEKALGISLKVSVTR